MPRAKEYQGTVSPKEIRMSHAEAEAEFDANHEQSWYRATELIKGQIAWLEYVPEEQLPSGEKERIILGCRKLYATLRPLTAKHID